MIQKINHPIQSVCKWFELSKSGFYKHLEYEKRKEIEEQKVLGYIKEIRKVGLMCGVRKMKRYIKKFFEFEIGRDTLLNIMQKHNYLCHYYKKHVITSNGKKSNYPNLLPGISVKSFGEVIVTDITYIHLYGGKFCYITIISDLKTRMILSHHVSNNLLTTSSLIALKKVFKKYSLPENAIHHSDHGAQYTSKEYTEYLRSKGMRISMTGDGKCYDNAQAERIFNTLKHEYGFINTFKCIDDVKKDLDLFVKNYNEKRMHESLNFKTPKEAYDAEKLVA